MLSKIVIAGVALMNGAVALDSIDEQEEMNMLLTLRMLQV